jgi:hypothetical protein
MKIHTAPTWLALVVMLGGFLLQTGRGSTVVWGSSFNDLLFTSTGQPLDNSFIFEVGIFTSGFLPVLNNSDQWDANWKVLDRAVHSAAEGWNVAKQYFVSSFEHLPDGTSDSLAADPADVFLMGETVYLWVYNSEAIGPGSEWALVTDSDLLGNLANAWRIPDPSDPVGTSYDWQLLDADTAILGGVNGIQGAGDSSVNPGTFSLQTHVVPEPGSSLLVLLALAAGTQSRGQRPQRCIE